MSITRRRELNRFSSCSGQAKPLFLPAPYRAMERTEAEKAIKKLGGKPTSSVSKKTNYLVFGENAGTKLLKAQELGITLLNETQFLADA